MKTNSLTGATGNERDAVAAGLIKNGSLSSQRYAATMWDFSYLTRREGDEAEYKDWDKVLDEAVERGYSLIRIDAFPHLIATIDEASGVPDEFTILPEPFSAQWGNKVPVKLKPLAGLIEFMGKCKDRGIKIAFSSWFNPDTKDLRSKICSPEDFHRVWKKTIQIVIDNKLDDLIVWIDICNEFPFPGWSPKAYEHIFGLDQKNYLPFLAPWSLRTQQRANEYLVNTVTLLKQDFPQFKFTFSSIHASKWNFFSSDYSACDIVEPHVWLTDSILFNILSLGILSLAQIPGGERLHSIFAPMVYKPFKKYWLRVLEKEMEELAVWSKKTGKPLFTTEGWATVMYGGSKSANKEKHWWWVKEINEEAVNMAIQKGWTGICTSNFSQPHFKLIWADIEWHKRLNGAITRGS